MTLLVSDLASEWSQISEHPTVVPLSDLRVTDAGLDRQGHSELWKFDGLTQEKFAKFLNVPDRYLVRCPAELVRHNLNYWLNEKPGEVALYTNGDNIVNVVDPESRSLPVSTYVNVITRAFSPTDEVDEFKSEPEYLHLDITSPEYAVEVPGDGSERRPAVGDITHAGLRVLAYPGASKAPVVATYLKRLVCTNGMQVTEAAGKISLRGKDVDEITDELRAVVTGLKSSLNDRLEDYRRTSEIQVAHRAQYVHNLAETRGLPRAVANRVMDLSSELGDETSLYDIMQIFTAVANEQVSYRTRLALQGLGGDFVSRTDEMTHRCQSCDRLFEPIH